MWLENLKELKKSKGLTSKQIAEKTNLPEGTIKRIFSGDTTNPYVDTLHRIVTVLGGSLDDILADTKAIVAETSLVELKENVEIVTAERDLSINEVSVLKDKVAVLTAEIDILRMQLKHKEELLALHNYYSKLNQNI